MSSASSSVERLLAPRHGLGICPRCLNPIGLEGLCRACRANEHQLAAVIPISYSVGGEWLHHLIASYKRDADPSIRDSLCTVTDLLEQFLARHEPCIAQAAGVTQFSIVTTVPSADQFRDLHHPLRRIVGERVDGTRDRYERLLVRSQTSAIPRVYDAARYSATRELGGEAVLLVDDMWTSGASAESAAGALLAAGAGRVAAVVLARHINRGWSRNGVFIDRLTAKGFGFERCVVCAGRRSTRKPAAAPRGDGGLVQQLLPLRLIP